MLNTAIPSSRGLGWLWETGCVKQKNVCVKFLPHMQPKKQFFSPFIKYWATFLAQ